MVCKKAFASRLLIIILSIILVLSFPLTVSAAVGVGSLWDGVITVSSDDSSDLFVEYSYYEKVFETPDSYYYDYSIADAFYTFKGKSSHIIEVQSNTSDIYLNGYIRKRLTAEVDTSSITAEKGFVGNLDVIADPIVLDNIYVTVLPVSSWYNGCIFDVYINFTDYYVNHKNFQLPLNIEYNCAIDKYSYQDATLPPRLPLNITVTEDYAGTIQQYDNLEDVPSVDGYFAEQNQQIIDNSQTQIQNQQTQIQQQEQANRLQQESNEQNKSFMDNFFSNLGNTVLGWIVPSSEQITDFFNEVNSWFSERLGFVWYPFDLAIQLVTALAGGTADTGFTVPAFSLNFQGQQLNIWSSFVVDIDAFDIFQYVRFFTSALLVCGIVKMAIDKWDEWIGGHNQ